MVALADALPEMKAARLCLDVGIQHAHNAGDKRQSNVVPLEGLRRVLERLQHPTHGRRVVPVLVRDRDACPLPALGGRSHIFIYIMCPLSPHILMMRPFFACRHKNLFIPRCVQGAIIFIRAKRVSNCYMQEKKN